MKYIIVLFFTVLAVNFSAIAQNKLKPAKAKLKPEHRVKQFWFVMLPAGSF